MTTFQSQTGSNGAQSTAQPNGHHEGIGHRVDEISSSAQQLWTQASGAVQDVVEAVDLRRRVDRHPYGMVLAAVGVGYVLGGGLFTPLTGRILRLGMRLAMLPMVKDELLGMAEAAVAGMGQQAPAKPPSGGQGV